MALNKQDILTVQDCKVVEVNVPEWGGSVFVKVMSGKQRDAWEEFVVAHKDKDGKINTAGLRSMLVATCVCDEFGNALFTDEDIPDIEKKNASVLQRIFDEAAKLNGLTGESAEAIKADFTKGQA